MPDPVDMSAPLPAIEIKDGTARFSLDARVPNDDLTGWSHEPRTPTLAHLAQVFPALTGEQRIWIYCQLSKAMSGDERVEILRRGAFFEDPRDEMLEQEKARADRAEQALAVVAAERDQLKALVATLNGTANNWLEEDAEES